MEAAATCSVTRRPTGAYLRPSRNDAAGARLSQPQPGSPAEGPTLCHRSHRRVPTPFSVIVSARRSSWIVPYSQRLRLRQPRSEPTWLRLGQPRSEPTWLRLRQPRSEPTWLRLRRRANRSGLAAAAREGVARTELMPGREPQHHCHLVKPEGSRGARRLRLLLLLIVVFFGALRLRLRAGASAGASASAPVDGLTKWQWTAGLGQDAL